MEIKYSKKAAKYINALDRPTKQRIKIGIEGLTEQPPKGDIKLLQGYSDNRKRLRVGKYRIIYNYLPTGELEILYIINIDSRDVYKRQTSEASFIFSNASSILLLSSSRAAFNN